MGAGLPLGPRGRRSFVIVRGRRDRVRSMRPMATVLQLSHSVSALAACRCMSQPRAGCRPLRVAKLCGLRPRTLSQRREGSTARSPDKPCPGAARQVWPAAGGRSGNPGTVRARASLRSRPAAWRAARPRPWTEGLLPVPRRGTKREAGAQASKAVHGLLRREASAGRAAGIFHPLRGHARGPQVRLRAWIRGRSRRVPASAVPRRRLAVPPPGRGSQARLRARPR